MGKRTAQVIVPDFLEEKTIKSLETFIKADSVESCACEIDEVARALGFWAKDFAQQSAEQEKKLVVSYKNNLLLLIQKTWVEKSDIELKEKIIYQIEEFCKDDNVAWSDIYKSFLDMIYDAVSLMFGQQTSSKDFAEWAFRIDPEFGIFWWYISSLPPEAQWGEDKIRVAVMLGMYFLANY